MAADPLPLGVPAAVTLVSMTLVAHQAVRCTLVGGGSAAQSVRMLTATLGAVAAIFWCWAMFNVVLKHNPDLGALTFACAVAACRNAHAIACSELCMLRIQTARRARCLLCSATSAVAANYMLVVAALPFVKMPISFFLYAAVGATYWLAATIAASRLLNGFIQALVEQVATPTDGAEWETRPLDKSPESD